MKGFKFMIAAALLAVATSASAQFANTSKSKEAVGANATSSSLKSDKLVNEISFYIQDGWGLGYQLRKDVNTYASWNIIGVSYMTAFDDPSLEGQVNFRLLGFRLYTPSFSSCRFYADLNMGYTLHYAEGYAGFSRAGFSRASTYIPGYGYYNYSDYDDYGDGETNVSHHFGLDFSVGLQIGKHFAVGYNLNYASPDDAKSHWARLSYLF